MTTDKLRKVLAKLPRVPLGLYPTPLVEARRLSAVLGGPRIFIKREDLCGLALGGNKCRHVEFILGHARQSGADAIVSISGAQSNYLIAMATGACRLGMKSSLVLMKDIHPEPKGNILLHRILGSDIQIADVPHEAVFSREMSARLDAIAEKLRAKGYHPFIIRHTVPDIATLLSSAAWVNASLELHDQMDAQGIRHPKIVLATATGGTLCGLALGFKALEEDCELRGISVWMKEAELKSFITERARAVAELLHLETELSGDDFRIDDGYIGRQYGVPTDSGLEAMKTVAQTEGVFLDPVYTSKAMSGLIDLINKGQLGREDTVIFIHTGGIPAIFAYDSEIVEASNWIR